MRAKLVGLAVVIIVAWAPATAFGHDVGTGAGHLAEDAATHTAAEEAQLTQHTRAATAKDVRAAAAAVVGNENQVGSWGPLMKWPVVGIHEALLPNGKVLAYDSVGDAATEKFTDPHRRAFSTTRTTRGAWGRTWRASAGTRRARRFATGRC
jgi:hypothetical protein